MGNGKKTNKHAGNRKKTKKKYVGKHFRVLVNC